jgi:hypothetical protein
MKTPHNNDVETISTQEFQQSSEDLLQTYQDIVAYNENIQNHLDCYKQFVPAHGILIRYKRRLPMLLKDGMIINAPQASDFAKMTKIAGSGQEYTLKEIATEFCFINEAVVVSIPEYNPHKFYVGQEVITEMPQLKVYKIDETVYANYMGWYVDPSSNMSVPTVDFKSPHFGYAILPSQYIIGWKK